jgi:hypothetical protein
VGAGRSTPCFWPSSRSACPCWWARIRLTRTGIPGWYDDADTDQLITQTLSPEGMIGVAALVLVCLSVRARPVGGIMRLHGIPWSREAVPRGPPRPMSRPPRRWLHRSVRCLPRPADLPAVPCARPSRHQFPLGVPSTRGPLESCGLRPFHRTLPSDLRNGRLRMNTSRASRAVLVSRGVTAWPRGEKVRTDFTRGGHGP